MDVFRKHIDKLVTLLVALCIVLITILYFFPQVFEVHRKNVHIDSIIYSDDYSLELSPEEKVWLNDRPVIRLGIDRDFPPFGAVTSNDEYIGYSADFIRLIEYRLGLIFDISLEAHWSETFEMAKSAEIDMISALVKTAERQEFLNFTEVFSYNPTVIFNDTLNSGYIGSLKNLSGKTISVEAGSYAEGQLSQKYPKITLLPVESTDIALQKVSTGEADAYVGNKVSAEYLIRNLGLHNLSFSGNTEFSSNHRMGIVKSNDQLLSVINKALESISKHDREAIANYWFGKTAQSHISKNTASLIASGLVGLLMLFGLWTYSLRKSKQELEESRELIKIQSEVDHLTGLANRRKFYSYIHQEMEKSDDSNKAFTLLFLDLDVFKEVNDSYGHAAGDLLLVNLSKRLIESVKDLGLIARIGGDEFMIILPEIEHKKDIEKICHDIASNLKKTCYINGNEINITCSVGITRYPDDADNVEQLLINADQAMYYSKRTGRNCYSYFSRVMQKEEQYKNHMINDIRNAIEEKQFIMHYQPIVDLNTNAITKAEALIRWNHPERGFISPAEFIPIAEDAGLINLIGEWTFREATEQTVKIRKTFDENFQMTVNTSPIQYRKNGMNVDEWCQHLQESGLTGDNIVVEITENILMKISDTVRDNLFKLRDLNIGVALDDFGTGYSSLSYLKEFDIDYLKIDRSFVSNLSEESEEGALVKAIIVMAHSLGIKVIAEGIETEDQKKLLIEANCDYGQGYYFSRPINSESFMKILHEYDSVNTDSVV